MDFRVSFILKRFPCLLVLFARKIAIYYQIYIFMIWVISYHKLKYIFIREGGGRGGDYTYIEAGRLEI